MTTAMTSRERIARAINHQEADRIAIQDAIWKTTEERWRREGLPEGVSPSAHFGFEMVRPGADTSLRFPTEVLEETDEYRIHRNNNGRVGKDWKDQTSTPMLLGYAIETPDDWLKHKSRLAPSEDRVNWGAFDRTCEQGREHGSYVCFTGGVGYQVITGRVHPDRLLEAMITDPEWVKDMVDAQTGLVLATLGMIVDRGYELDGFWCSDDLGYRNGLMFSPKVFHELFAPAHRALCDFCHQHGIATFLHTCGNVNEVVDDLIEIGWDCLQPLEVKAQMDVIQLKRDFGDRLTLMGGIDVRVLAEGTDEELEAEVRGKLEVAKEHGGYIYHSDHSVPDNVSFERYTRTIELVKEYGRYNYEDRRVSLRRQRAGRGTGRRLPQALKETSPTNRSPADVGAIPWGAVNCPGSSPG